MLDQLDQYIVREYFSSTEIKLQKFMLFKADVYMIV